MVKAIKEGIGGTTVNTAVNTGNVGDGVDKSSKLITMGSLQKEVRDEQREARNRLDQVKQSSNVIQQYLKGNMSPEVAQKFGEKMKALGWTKNDFEAAGKKAIDAQLLSKSKQEKQQQDVDKIARALEKMGLK